VSDLATDVCLISIEKVIYLRNAMVAAVSALNAGDTEGARIGLVDALKETDIGAMKVWQAGEEPF
jgi:hypothetical protein